jgi:hypothetical protein
MNEEIDGILSRTHRVNFLNNEVLLLDIVAAVVTRDGHSNKVPIGNNAKRSVQCGRHVKRQGMEREPEPDVEAVVRLVWFVSSTEIERVLLQKRHA